MKFFIATSLALVCSASFCAPVVKNSQKNTSPVVKPSLFPVVPPKLPVREGSIGLPSNIDLPAVVVDVVEKNETLVVLNVTVERRSSALNTAPLPESPDKKPFIAQLSVMLDSTTPIHNSTTSYYLDNEKVVPVEEFERLTVTSVGTSLSNPPADNSTYCFDLDFQSQYVSFFTLSADQRRPFLNKQQFHDVVCLKKGEERSFAKNLRMFPAEWKFTLNNVTLFPKTSAPAPEIPFSVHSN